MDTKQVKTLQKALFRTECKLIDLALIADVLMLETEGLCQVVFTLQAELASHLCNFDHRINFLECRLEQHIGRDGRTVSSTYQESFPVTRADTNVSEFSTQTTESSQCVSVGTTFDTYW